MTVAARAHDLPALVSKAGVSDLCARYLTERGLRIVGAIALISADQATFVEPLASGWQGAAETFRLTTEEYPIGKATLLYLRELCIEQRQHESAAAAAAIALPLPAAPSAAAAPVKAPTDLAPGEWKKLVTRYNQQQIGGRDRVFPEALLLGEEAILAKAQFKHEHSKAYSPIPLGSVIQCRTLFFCKRGPEPLTKRKQETKVKVTPDGEIHVEAAEDVWGPGSMLSILDGLQSIRYLFVVLQIGDEQDVHACFDTLERKGSEHTEASRLSGMKFRGTPPQPRKERGPAQKNRGQSLLSFFEGI